MPNHWLIIHLLYNAAILAPSVFGAKYLVSKLPAGYTFADVEALKAICFGEDDRRKDGKVGVKLTPFDSQTSAKLHSDWDILKPAAGLTAEIAELKYKSIFSSLVAMGGFGNNFWPVVKYPKKPWEILELTNVEIQTGPSDDIAFISYASRTSSNWKTTLKYVVLGKDDLLTNDWSHCETAESPSKTTSLTANIEIPKNDLPSLDCKILLRDTNWPMDRNWMCTTLTKKGTKINGSNVVVPYSPTGPNLRVVRCKWRIEVIGETAQEAKKGLMTFASGLTNFQLSFHSDDLSQIQQRLKTGHMVVQTQEVNTMKEPQTYWDVLPHPISAAKKSKAPFFGKNNDGVIEIEYSTTANTWYDIALLPKRCVPPEHLIWIAELNTPLQQLVLKKLTAASLKTLSVTRIIFARKRTQGIPPGGTWREVQLKAQLNSKSKAGSDFIIPFAQIVPEEDTFSKCEVKYLSLLNEEADFAAEKCWSGWHHNKKIEVAENLYLDLRNGALLLIRTTAQNGDPVTGNIWKRLNLPEIIIENINGSVQVQQSIIKYDNTVEYAPSKKFEVTLVDNKVPIGSTGGELFEGVLKQKDLIIKIPKDSEKQRFLRQLESGLYVVVITEKMWIGDHFQRKGKSLVVLIPKVISTNYLGPRKMLDGVIVELGKELGNTVPVDEYNRNTVIAPSQ